MKARLVVVNVGLLALSLFVGAILCEAAARLLLNPADYLSVTMLPDPVLGIRVASNSAGFDGWGFRNPFVPQAADIVALGDSHTFGNTAVMDDAWPSVVGRDTGMSVYNLGLGGYGPNQYFQLLMTRGLSLHPKHVICGLYMGDDFEGAYSFSYGLEHWAFLRAGEGVSANPDVWGDAEPVGPLKDLRNWLSGNSMVYRLVVHGPVLGALKGSLQLGLAGRDSDPAVTTFENADQNIREAFRPIQISAWLDQSRPEVKEGMRITFHLLKEMDRACDANGCSFSVVIIPTKETVFADYLQRAPGLHLNDVLDSVITNERMARTELEAFLSGAGIPYVDALPALRQAVSTELYYRGPADMHPNKNGYKVIGDAVAAFLRDSGTRSN